MKAAVYYGPNKVEVADVPEPEPTAGTVKVKVGFNGICGTDLHEYYADPFCPHRTTSADRPALPLTIGHEFSGVITDVGPGVTGYSAGDRVAIDRSTDAVNVLRAGRATTTSVRRSASTA